MHRLLITTTDRYGDEIGTRQMRCCRPSSTWTATSPTEPALATGGAHDLQPGPSSGLARRGRWPSLWPSRDRRLERGLAPA